MNLVPNPIIPSQSGQSQPDRSVAPRSPSSLCTTSALITLPLPAANNDRGRAQSEEATSPASNGSEVADTQRLNSHREHLLLRQRSAERTATSEDNRPSTHALPQETRNPQTEHTFRKPRLPPSQTKPPRPSLAHASKHAREDTGSRPVSTERASKRVTRPQLKARHTLEPQTLLPSSSPLITSPPSPLFFSHTQRQRPLLPTGVSSSSETAATMLSRTRDEPAGITTLKLARGAIPNGSPPRASTIFGRRLSFEKIPRSPDFKVRSAAGMQLLGSVGIVELLEQDERPTFIIDVANPSNFRPGAPLQIIFANASLRAYESILEMVTGKPNLDSPGVGVTNDFPEFKSWALSFVRDDESLDICLPSFAYGGVTWTCNTLRKRLRLISASGNATISGNASGSSTGGMSNSSARTDRKRTSRGTVARSPLATTVEPADYFGAVSLPSSSGTSPQQQIGSSPGLASASPTQTIRADSHVLTLERIKSHFPEAPSFDWTRFPVSAALPKHIQFVLNFDWASTPLGPIEEWGFALRAMCNQIMASPHPVAMYWGPDNIIIYNEAYILLAGQKHPKLMGQPYATAWSEIWDDIGNVFALAREAGHSTMRDDDQLFLKRNGFLEESYFSWSIIPLVGEDGSVAGLYNPAFDKTRRKIAERRMLTLREVGEKTSAARDVKGFWGQVIKGLEYNEYDVPFVFLYSVSEETDSDMSSMHSGSLSQAPQCILEGTLGVPQGHKAAMSPLDLKTSEGGFAPSLRESMKTDGPILLTTDDGTLSSELIEGLQWRGFGDQCRAAVVCPIQPTTGETVLGFLVMGINPRRPYDDDYSLFIQLLSRQLATSMASVVLFEEEIRRGQRAARLAALDRQELSKQLDIVTQEAVESETKFTRMAEFSPVGMFIANESGMITYSNDTWWEISRHPRSEHSVNTWMESIKDEDRPGVEEVWEALVKNKTPITHEFRFKTPWEDRNGHRSDTWVLMSVYPERSEHGKLKSVFGSITNISQQKWAEDFQKRRMEEAIEMKRQQENFIDMTSHEMRNPLSAILQCADEISSSLTGFRDSPDEGEKLADVLEGGIDAAQTIALCAQHQKRIVDDILTLSKLDSALLIVTPVSVQPVSVVQRALKMFEGELESNDIAMEFRMERSYLDLEIDWVKLDPSRLLQVLINLTTNAIKFTHGQEKRNIVVSIGASRGRPSSSDSSVSYFPSRSNRKDLTTDESEWGTGEELCLHFAVQDTGRGLDPKEKTLLFQRFSQASPRTHVQYGGSGLGLFISRELTELQGGEIGVSSEKGVGSTFAFYVKARKVESMTEDTPIASAVKSLRRNSSNSSVTFESRKNSSGKAIHRSHTTGQTRRTSSLSANSLPILPSTPKTTLDHSEMRVLIVEDNLINQKVLRNQLKKLGFMTEVANHGGEALDMLKTSTFWTGREQDGIEISVVLMDLEMPIMDGLSCARAIRDFETDGTIVNHVPIIAVTANARIQQIETAITAGMDDVVSKPFRTVDLIPKIDELVTKYKPNAATPITTPTPISSPMQGVILEAGPSSSS